MGVSALVAVQLKGPARADAEARLLLHLKHVARVYPDQELHLIMDNYATHKRVEVRDWLAANPRIHAHFTPTSGSWLNLVEVWFGIIERQAIRRGTFRSLRDLTGKIRDSINGWNTRRHTLIWTKTRGCGMADLLRVGLVGPSWFAETVHLAGLDSHPRAVVTAVCGRNRANAEAVAARHGNPVVFTDYRTMFASDLLDAVVIAVPDYLHLHATLAAAEAGLHVLCEKPLARTASDARKMLDAAVAAGVVHMTMMTWRWLPIPAFAKRLVEGGYLGRVRSAHFSMQSGYDAEMLAGWRFDPERGTGILGYLGSHMIDLARSYVGEIARVCARLICDVGRQNSDGQALTSPLDGTSLCQLVGLGVVVGSAAVGPGSD